MKKSIKLSIALIFLLIPAVVFCLFSCTEENPEPVAQVKKLYISSVSMNLDVGSSHTLTVAEHSLGEDTVLNWSSSSPEVAICEGGVVTAISPGTARITVESEGYASAYCVISVRENVKRHVNVERISDPVRLVYEDPASGRRVEYEVAMLLSDPKDKAEPHFKCQYNPYQENTVEIRVTFSVKKISDTAEDGGAFTYYINLFKEEGAFCETQTPGGVNISVGESASFVMIFNAYVYEAAREFYFEISAAPYEADN